MHADHPAPAPLRVGYVPEHFSTPLHFLQDKILPLMHPTPLTIELLPFPSGTGAMISSLSTHSIDVAVGLTEGWIAGLAQGKRFYRLIGSYVESPLRWAISTGAGRQSEFLDPQGRLQLQGKKLGVSRIGSGSHIMGYVLAERAGWLDTSSNDSNNNPPKPPFDFVVLNDFAGLRSGVNSRTADAFMWEYYTSKKYYTTNPPELALIGELPTPWPSWHIVCQWPPTSHPLNPDPRVSLFLIYLNSAIEYFDKHPEEAVDFIANSQDMHYSREDAEAWMKEVIFVKDTRKVDKKVVESCMVILRKAGVVPAVDGAQGGVKTDEMFVPVTW
ncbi:hypothetical protein BGX38DRAFT_1096046 [Terfezia claveryi]|nr:hypothetical protein BGX38DRAFT_1096046 [Terfezia claveryi]